jgi:hypothetical protein
MQNARLSELEAALAKSSVVPMRRGIGVDAKSSEEYNALKEENRVVSGPSGEIIEQHSLIILIHFSPRRS